MFKWEKKFASLPFFLHCFHLFPRQKVSPLFIQSPSLEVDIPNLSLPVSSLYHCLLYTDHWCLFIQVMTWMMTLSWWRNWPCRFTELTQHCSLGGLRCPIHPPYIRPWTVWFHSGKSHVFQFLGASLFSDLEVSFSSKCIVDLYLDFRNFWWGHVFF